MMPSKDAFFFVSVVAYISVANLGARDGDNIKAGDVFMGAWPSAAQRGFGPGLLRDLYTNAYLINLKRNYPDGVPCYRDNVVCY